VAPQLRHTQGSASVPDASGEMGDGEMGGRAVMRWKGEFCGGVFCALRDSPQLSQGRAMEVGRDSRARRRQAWRWGQVCAYMCVRFCVVCV
jgi:hypothetical protein